MVLDNKDNIKLKYLVALIILAYIFSVGIRYIWVYTFNDIDSFKWNDQLMINTNDGYAYAEGARDILAGFHQDNDLSKLDQPLSLITAFFAKIIPVQFETLILYMPAFVSSLIVIPLILLGRSIGNTYMGFISALLASIAWSYYNRTMIGYYDTDMLSVLLPTIEVMSIVWALTHKKEKHLITIALSITFYQWYYPQAYSLDFAILLTTAFYIAVFDRKDIFNYKLLLFILVGVLQLDPSIKVVLILGLYLFFLFYKKVNKNHLIALFGIFIITLAFTGGIDPIIGKVKDYFFKGEPLVGNLGLNFFSVMQTVRESGNIDFNTLGNRISGHPLILIFSIIGYIFLLIRYRVFIITLPMVGLGLMALYGGLRFTVYAVPIFALGAGYLIFLMMSFLENIYKGKNLKIFQIVFVALATVIILYPNIKHIIEYKIPTVFTKQEVQVLDKLKNIASREDYVISWWDYGYPLRYYSDVKTLVDGGLHDGNVNYPVSLILNTSSQLLAANLARFSTFYHEKFFEEKRSIYDYYEQILIDYKYKDANKFIDDLRDDLIPLPEKKHDMYLYLPNRMLNIFPTVTLFSNLDLMTGDKKARPFLFKSTNFRDNGNIIDLGNGIKILKNKGQVQLGNRTLAINALITTQYGKDGKLNKRAQYIDRNSPISIIFMRNYNTFLVVDSKMFNSVFIQLFVLENYDGNLFEPVILSPHAKVYKIKR